MNHLRLFSATVVGSNWLGGAIAQYRQGANSVTEALRNLPGFAINDTGFGADIDTGLFYRRTTLNQNTFLLILNNRSREFSPSWLNLDFNAQVPITKNLVFLALS